MGEKAHELHRYRTEAPLTFAKAVEAWGNLLNGAVVIAYGAKCTVTTLDEVPDDAFECRAFNESSELRWLKAGEGAGNAVLLSTHELELSEGDWKVCDFRHPIICAQDNEYLLWGKRKGTTTTLFDHRVGELSMPTLPGGGGGQRAVLKAIEYIGVDDEYGNCAVLVERLAGFAWLPSIQASNDEQTSDKGAA